MLNSELLSAWDILKSQAPSLPSLPTVWVAYSGGIDSTVLLHSLVDLAVSAAFSLKAIHINHNLHADADKWRKHCQQVCEKLDVPLCCLDIQAQAPQGESQEAWARKLRYQAMLDVMATDDILVTAHHQNDQAETVLLQLFRGAGTHGLAAIPAVQVLQHVYLWRPLLTINKQQITQFAEQASLQWVTDPSNQQLHFERNFIRHNILPQLQQRWPAIVQTLQRVSANCQDDRLILQSCAEQDWQYIKTHQANKISIQGLQTLSVERQMNVLRYWIQQLKYPLPTRKQLQTILKDMLTCRSDATPQVKWGDVCLRRYRDALFLYPQTVMVIDPNAQYRWQPPAALQLPQGWLSCQKILGQGLRPELLINTSLTIRARQGGERIHAQGRSGSHPLKKCFQEWGIPPWLREQVPLLYADEQLIAVIGFCIAKMAAVGPDEWGWVLRLENKSIELLM